MIPFFPANLMPPRFSAHILRHITPGRLAAFVMGVALFPALAMAQAAAPGDPTVDGMASLLPLWAWPLVLFAFTAFLGVLAVMGGIGGSVLFVPLVSGFLPFIHIDFVRGAGLMVALTGALSAGPGLLRNGMANLRLAMPIALITSTASIAGALIGLALPAQQVQIALGVVILSMSVFMYFSKTSGHSETTSSDPLVRALGIQGSYWDADQNKDVTWAPRRMALGLVMFSGVGLMAGLFGLGAGWANVPLLNLVMGVPLKVAVASSYFLLAITDTTAAWIYLNKGAVLPLLVIPSVAGIMVGARLGARLLHGARPSLIRKVVIVVLFLAGLRALIRGLTM